MVVSHSKERHSRDAALTGHRQSMLPRMIRAIGRTLYVRAFRRNGVAIWINSRRYRVSSAIARGIPRHIDPPALRHWLELVRGQQCVVDAGANVGIWSVLAAPEMPRDATILAVEPSPASYEILVDCARVAEGPAHIIPVQAALGDHTGIAHLALDAPSAPTNHLSAIASDANSVEVPLITLDDLLAAKGLEPAVIKVDVEGAELWLLRGARNTMREARPVVVLELHWGTELGLTPEALLAVTREYRYAIHDDNDGIVDTPAALLAQNFVIMRPRSDAP